jgi:hypothetical protein
VGKSDYLHAVHVTEPETGAAQSGAAQLAVGVLARVRITAVSANSLAGERIAAA